MRSNCVGFWWPGGCIEIAQQILDAPNASDAPEALKASAVAVTPGPAVEAQPVAANDGLNAGGSDRGNAARSAELAETMGAPIS